MKLRVLLLAGAAVLTAGLVSAVALSRSGNERDASWPRSIASIGDSITSGFNACPSAFADCPAGSWSTGSVEGTLYRRILAASPEIEGHSWSFATAGAELADLGNQVDGAIARRPDLVTILIGANDLCAPSVGEMTPVRVFRAEFRRTLARLRAGLPEARVFVASIPDLRRLWSLYRHDLVANAVWTIGGICPSLLARAFSDRPEDKARRAQVAQRNVAYNIQLAEVCASSPRCRFDGDAVFRTNFGRDDVSARDYFHPSAKGQAKLARVAWDALRPGAD